MVGYRRSTLERRRRFLPSADCAGALLPTAGLACNYTGRVSARRTAADWFANFEARAHKLSENCPMTPRTPVILFSVTSAHDFTERASGRPEWLFIYWPETHTSWTVTSCLVTLDQNGLLAGQTSTLWKRALLIGFATIVFVAVRF